MNPFKNIFGKRAIPATAKDNSRKTIQRDEYGRVVSAVDLDRYLGVFDSRVSESNLITLFNEISEIQFPIRAIAERALNADIYLKDFSTDSIIWKNKEINKFITQPNELESFDRFFMNLMIYYLLLGDAYVYSHIPKTLRSLPRWESCNNYYVLPSDKIEVETHDRVNLYSGAKIEEIIKAYRLKDGKNDIEFLPENILHLRDVNMLFDKDMLQGRSRMQSLKYPITNLIAVYEARNIIYVKRGALGMLVNRKKDDFGSVGLTQRENKEVLDSYYATYGVKSGDSPISVSNVDLDFVKIGISISELEPFKETLNDAIQIAGAFGVPSDLVPREDQSTFSNKRQAEVSLYENVVIPVTNRIIESFNYWLGFKEEYGGMYLCADFSKVPCLQDDKKMLSELNSINSERAINQFKSGVITYNEMRVACGYEKVENGDCFVWDSNNIRGIKENQNDTEITQNED